MSSLDALVTYLTDNGMDESEIDHFLKQRIFAGKSIIDLIREDQWSKAWDYATAYISGESW